APDYKVPQNTSPRLQLVASDVKWRNFTPRRSGDLTVSVAQFASGIHIQALLGHTKLTTTARYASVATGMISAVESPLDNLSQAAKRKKDKKGAL
ncbi:MAG: hypothetical protein AAGK37_23475, partial [Pseudomonadota bacterium]